MILGISTGCFHKHLDPASQQVVDIIRSLGCNAIELHTGHGDRLDRSFDLDLSGFAYRILHGSTVCGGKDHAKMREVLDKFLTLHKRLKFDAIVFHPDEILDYTVFDEFDLPYAFENMDTRKKSHTTVAEMKELLEKKDARMVLDIQHTYEHDPSMSLADDFLASLKDRIIHIHISGCCEVTHECGPHGMMHLQDQSIIAQHTPSDIPLIIESVIPGDVDFLQVMQDEIDFIKKHIRSQ